MRDEIDRLVGEAPKIDKSRHDMEVSKAHADGVDQGIWTMIALGVFGYFVIQLIEWLG